MKKYILIASLTICGLQAMGLFPNSGDIYRAPSPVLTSNGRAFDFSAGNGGFWGGFAPEHLKDLALKHEKEQKITAAKAYLIELIQKIDTTSGSDQQENKDTFERLTDIPVENVSNAPEEFVNSLSSQTLVHIQKKIAQNKSDTESEPQKQ